MSYLQRCYFPDIYVVQNIITKKIHESNTRSKSKKTLSTVKLKNISTVRLKRKRKKRMSRYFEMENLISKHIQKLNKFLGLLTNFNYVNKSEEITYNYVIKNALERELNYIFTELNLIVKMIKDHYIFYNIQNRIDSHKDILFKLYITYKK